MEASDIAYLNQLGLLKNFIYLFSICIVIEQFAKKKPINSFFIGIIFSVATIIHMTSSVETAVEMGEHGALKHTRIMYVVRMAALIVVFALMLILGIGNIFAMLFGLLSLKLSAYLQPITRKLRKGR